MFSVFGLLVAAGLALLVTRGVEFYYDSRVPSGLPTGWGTYEFEDMHFIFHARLRGILPGDEWPDPITRDPAMRLTGHTILEGERTVLLWRLYTNPPGEDNAGYKMLTVELEPPRSGQVFTLPSHQARGFYSEGSSSWGGGWYCDDPVGTVRIDDWPGDGSAVVTVDFSLPMIDPTADGEEKNREPITFQKTLRLSKITRYKLTPWLNGGLRNRPD